MKEIEITVSVKHGDSSLSSYQINDLQVLFICPFGHQQLFGDIIRLFCWMALCKEKMLPHCAKV